MKVSGHEEILEFKQLEQINSGQILQDIKSIYKELKVVFPSLLPSNSSRVASRHTSS